MPTKETTNGLIKVLENEIEGLQKIVPSLNGDPLYRTAKEIVHKMELLFILLDDDSAPPIENLPVRKQAGYPFSKGDYNITIFAQTPEEAQQLWEELQRRNYYPTSGIHNFKLPEGIFNSIKD